MRGSFPHIVITANVEPVGIAESVHWDEVYDWSHRKYGENDSFNANYAKFSFECHWMWESLLRNMTIITVYEEIRGSHSHWGASLFRYIY